MGPAELQNTIIVYFKSILDSNVKTKCNSSVSSTRESLLPASQNVLRCYDSYTYFASRYRQPYLHDVPQSHHHKTTTPIAGAT